MHIDNSEKYTNTKIPNLGEGQRVKYGRHVSKKTQNAKMKNEQAMHFL